MVVGGAHIEDRAKGVVFDDRVFALRSERENMS
jgi:hypothetical protein